MTSITEWEWARDKADTVRVCQFANDFHGDRFPGFGGFAVQKPAGTDKKLVKDMMELMDVGPEQSDDGWKEIIEPKKIEKWLGSCVADKILKGG